MVVKKSSRAKLDVAMQLSFAKLRRDRVLAFDRAESSNGFIRKDLFGFIDIVALLEGCTLGIQTTTYPGAKSRINKIGYKNEKAVAWLRANNLIEVWEWKKFDEGNLELKIVSIFLPENSETGMLAISPSQIIYARSELKVKWD